MDILKSLGIHRWFLLCLGMWVQPGREEDVNTACRYGCEMTQPWWVMDQSGEKEREVVGDLRAAVGQDEDMRASPRLSVSTTVLLEQRELRHSLLPQSVLTISYEVAAWPSYREIRCHTMCDWQVGSKLSFTPASRSMFRIYCGTLVFFFKWLITAEAENVEEALPRPGYPCIPRSWS